MDEEGVMALIVAILFPVEITPEQAFEYLEPRKVPAHEFERLREAGMTYSQIGSVYGLSKGTVFNRLKRRRLRGMLDEEVE